MKIVNYDCLVNVNVVEYSKGPIAYKKSKFRNEKMRKNLLLKAQQNMKTGAWAEKNEFFDVAVSRFYYALYEKILYISKKEGFYSTPPIDAPHNYTLKKFKENILKKLGDEDRAWIAHLGKLKKCRVCADYEEDIIVDTRDFNLTFKAYYNSISEILEKFI